MDKRDEKTLLMLAAFLRRPYQSKLVGFVFGGEDPKALATVFFDQGEFVFFTEEGKQAAQQSLKDAGLSSPLTDRMMGTP